MIKNYTSSVPALRSISRIEQVLVEAGATGISKEYIEGKVASLVFKISLGQDKPDQFIKLPANVEACQEVLWRDHTKKRSVRGRKKSSDFLEQAERTAWRLLSDWVEVQTSLIKLGQMDALQAFLAYCYDGQRTVYQKIVDSNYKALLPAPR